jgi:DNA-binding transcriptional regulator YdaS (Cro superfamily)
VEKLAGPQQLDKYAQAFAHAMLETGVRNTTVAAYLGGSINYSNVSQWRTGRRPIPAEYAPALAVLLNVTPESISKAFDQGLRAQSALTTMAAQGVRTGVVSEGYVAIDRLGELGRGDGPSRIVLPDFLIRRKIGLTPLTEVRWAFQPSRTMEPEIERHALVLIDASVCQHHQVIDGGIYAYTLWGRPDIRRVTIRRNAWSLMGNGREIERMEVPETDLANLHVLGAVVGWL